MRMSNVHNIALYKILAKGHTRRFVQISKCAAKLFGPRCSNFPRSFRKTITTTMPYKGVQTLLNDKSPQIAKMKDINNFLNNIAGIDITTSKGRDDAMWHTRNITLIELDSNSRLPNMHMANLREHFWLELLMDLRGAIMTASYDAKGGVAAWKFCLLRLNSILHAEEHVLSREQMEAHLGITWHD
uniref:Myb_DNA-bind_3 domain-containing protein n=1 Tax=Panagrellus redivivus TaxID=6233 RepID=A0A7E4VYD3_PANRE